MDNSINFKGSFLIKQATPEVIKTISPILGRKDKNKIIQNVMNQGDILFVSNKSHDKEIAEAVLSIPNIIFKYFPNITPKSGFVNFDPKEAREILKQNSKTAISTKGGLLSTIRKPLAVKKHYIKVAQEKNLKCAQKAFFFDLNDKEYIKNIDVQNGVCTVYKLIKDSITHKLKKHLLLEITPPGQYGICYATYTPVEIQYNTRRIAIKNGEKIFEYDGPSETFNKNAALAKHHYLEQMIK